jgi:hypothetical protein
MLYCTAPYCMEYTHEVKWRNFVDEVASHEGSYAISDNEARLQGAKKTVDLNGSCRLCDKGGDGFECSGDYTTVNIVDQINKKKNGEQLLRRQGVNPNGKRA